MAQDKKAQSIIRSWAREISSLVFAILIGLAVFVRPMADPLSAATPQQAVMYCVGVGMLYLFYLIWQGWPLVLGQVGAAFSQTTDAVASSLPGIPALFAIVLHFLSFQTLSFSMMVLAGTTLAIVAFDVIIFGGIGSLVNRLTNDMYMRNKND